MIKFGALPEDINHFLPDVREYLNKHPRVLFAYLFGGLARGRVSPLSDVDIAIYLADGSDIAQEKLETLGMLNKRLKTDEVDMVILNTAPLILRKITELDEYLGQTREFSSITLEEYSRDWKAQRIVETPAPMTICGFASNHTFPRQG